VDEIITYGQTPALIVNTSPAGLEYVRVIVGIDGDAQNFVSIDFPASTKELMKVKVMGCTVFDGYSYIAGRVGDGVSVDEFRSIVNEMISMIAYNPTYCAAAKAQGLDYNAFATVYAALDQVETLDASAKVRLGQVPKNAGVYLVTAVSTNLCYCNVMDTGYLTILPKTSSVCSKVELRFNAEIPGIGNVLSYEDAQSFNFGGKMFVNGWPKESTHVKASYTGTTFAGEFIPPQSEPITVPGVYTETIYVLGGNYYATPIVRTYTVDRKVVDLAMDDETVTYDGEPHSLTAYDKNGEDIADDIVYYYVGEGYKSFDPPVNAGTYTVYASYPGDAMHKPAMVVGTLTIEKAAAVVTVICAEEVPYGDIDKEHMAAAELDMTIEGVIGNDHLGAFVFDFVDETGFANVGEYEFTAVPVFDTNPNYEITYVNDTMKIVPRDVTITFDEKVKYYGDADPELTVRISDLGLGEPLNYELVRDEGEDVGRYDIHCILGENPNYNITLVNDSNHGDDYVPVISGKLDIAATGVDGSTDDEEVTGDFYIIPRPIDVTVGSATKYEDEPDPEIPVNITDDDGTVYDSDNVGLEIERVWDEELNGYWLIPSINNPNYELRNAQEGFLKILKRSTAPTEDDNKQETNPAAPKTGDFSTLMIFLMSIVMAVTAAVLIRFKKKSR
jgi:LPXTG-motif cell wall-anchored protein